MWIRVKIKTGTSEMRDKQASPTLQWLNGSGYLQVHPVDALCPLTWKHTVATCTEACICSSGMLIMQLTITRVTVRVSAKFLLCSVWNYSAIMRKLLKPAIIQYCPRSAYMGKEVGPKGGNDNEGVHSTMTH